MRSELEARFQWQPEATIREANAFDEQQFSGELVTQGRVFVVPKAIVGFYHLVGSVQSRFDFAAAFRGMNANSAECWPAALPEQADSRNACTRSKKDLKAPGHAMKKRH